MVNITRPGLSRHDAYKSVFIVLAASAVVILCVMAVALRAMTTAHDHVAPKYPVVGAQFHGMWDDYTPDERGKVLDELAGAGVEWLRIDLSWAMLEPEEPGERSSWGLNFADEVLGMAAARGFKVLVMFWLTPAWANDSAGERALPDRPADYAAAAEWVAERYAEEVDAWQVWNEPNDDDFMRGADAAAYVRLLQEAYPAIKAGDPGSTVVFGGTSYNDADWIAEAYDAGAAGFFDALATHPYQGVADEDPRAPDDGTKWRLAHIAVVRQVMVANGDADLPLWVTEFGWSSHDNSGSAANWERGVTREQQATNLVDALEVFGERHPYVTHAFWYRERDAPERGLQNGNYGLLDADLRPKPALEALRAALAEAGRIDG